LKLTRFIHGHTLRANNIRQHYLRFGGEGHPLILIPGIMTPAPIWDFVGDRLGVAYDTYVMDVRGRGLSETGDELDYSLDAYADDVAGLARTLGFKKYSIVGHSMGARIALRTASRHGDAIDQIVMIDPPVSGPGRRRYPVPLDRVVDRLAKAKRGELWEATKDEPFWSDHSKRVRAEWTHTCNEVAVLTTHRNFHDEDIFPDFGKTKVRTSLMVATRGGTIEQADIDEIKGRMPSIMVDRVEAGHMIPFENEDGFFVSLGKLLGTKI
jgi:N-formylmaleamate deformylase